MNGGEFLKLVRKYAKRNQLSYEWQSRRGKGSHGRCYVDGNFTTVKDRTKEIGPGLLHEMLKQLEIDREDL